MTALTAVLAAGAIAPAGATTNSAADFTISPTVIATNPPNLGFNFSNSPGNGNITDNSWISDGGFAPFDIRLDATATQDGAADGTTFICTGSPGTDFYASLANGIFVGAQARVYRFNNTNSTWALVRTGVVSGYTADSSKPNDPASHTITFSTTGPQVLSGDAIWLIKDSTYSSPDYNTILGFLDPRFTAYSPTWNRAAGGDFVRNDISTETFVHDTDVPSGLTNGGSSTPPLSIKITDTSQETSGIGQYIQGTSVGPADEAFEAGHTYQFSVWLKQQGIGDGSATVGVANLGISHTFTGVTGAWQKFTYQFPAPASLPAGSAVPGVYLNYNAPGTLWAAQFELFDTATAPYSLDPRILQLWKNYKPGTIRFWSNNGNSAGNYSFWSLDSWLTDESMGRSDIGIGNQYEKVSDTEHLPTALATAKQVGTNPWFIVNPSLSEADWGNLIDYLCAPAGVGYASRRPASHPNPYTDDFGTIYLEFGNEEWGTQTTATTYPTTQERYGAYAHHMVSQAIAGKSYYNKSKLQFIANGFTAIPSLTTNVMRDFTEASLVDYFSYSGGDSSLTGDAYYQNELLSVPEGNGATNGSAGSGGVGLLLAQATAQQQQDAANGIHYGTAVYEGGPGGDAPGSTSVGDTTLAAATTAIDTALADAANGFGPQNFFLYALGTGPYSSHTNFANGLIPHPVWEAYQMRNNYCAGDMVSVVTNSVPKTTDTFSAPLVAVYAFHNGNNYDIAVVSRDLNNSTPVTLHLPQSVASSATLYTLTGDPRADNNSSLKVPIGQQSLNNFSQNYSFTMPAGSFYIFQATASGVTPTAATPTFSPAGGTYTSAQSVTLSDSTSGAAIHYTTDGTTPTASSPTYSGTIAVSTTTTLKAIATASGYNSSAVAAATYTINTASLIDRTAETGGTILARGDNAPNEGKAQAFDNNINTKWLDFSSTSWISYQFANNAAYVITQYKLTSGNDTASYPGRALKSWVLKSSNDGTTWTTLNTQTNAADTLNLDTKVYSFSNSTAYKIYKLDTIVSNGDPIIQMSELRLLGPSGVTPTAATPTFSPAGGTYTSAQSVTLSDSTSGAAIHYTTDGTTPTASSPTYSGTIAVSTTTTLKAIATASGYNSSAVAAANYTITGGGPNLIANPGYETGALGSWLGGGSVFGVNSASPHSGTYDAYNNGAYNSIFQNISGLTPNTAYTLTVWAKDSVTGHASIYVNNYGGAEIDQAISSTGYSQYTIHFTTGASATSAQIGEFSDGTNNVSYVDDWSLTTP